MMKTKRPLLKKIITQNCQVLGFITQNCQVLGFMIRCTQYEKPIPVPKDRFAFSFVLSQKKLA